MDVTDRDDYSRRLSKAMHFMQANLELLSACHGHTRLLFDNVLKLRRSMFMNRNAVVLMDTTPEQALPELENIILLFRDQLEEVKRLHDNIFDAGNCHQNTVGEKQNMKMDSSNTVTMRCQADSTSDSCTPRDDLS